MAGHSKWANIRHRKGAQDAKRGKIFTKLIREITVAARAGGGDEQTNPRLRDVVIKALKANMKRDTIDQAIKRGVGGLEGAHMVEMRYEGYGPHGVALLVHCLSDNKNRTVSEVRHAFTKAGGHLGTENSVAYLFEQQGAFLLAPTVSEDEVMDLAIDAGAVDVSTIDGQVEIIAPGASYHTLLNALQSHHIAIEEAELTMSAQTKVWLSEAAAESVEHLMDALEDLDDVQTVYTNHEVLES